MVEKDFSNEMYAIALENAIAFGSAKTSSVLPKLFQYGLKKEQIGKIVKEVDDTVKNVNSMSKDKVEKEFESYKKLLKEKKPEEERKLRDLPNVKKKVILRMAPFPSGTLHLGNAKTYLLNALYAEKYKGKVLLVIDDTIGSKDKPIAIDAYKLIPEAFNLLNVKYEKPILYKSDRLKIYYKYAEKLIRKDKAYVCSCNRETLRQNRADEIECGCRQYPVGEQMERWKKMFKADEGDYVLRIKTSMHHKNPAFRDRVLFRISDKDHPKTRKKYKVWPLLEFSWAVDDHLFGITHVIRGKELMIEGEMQKYIWDIFKWKHPELIYVGLIKLEGIGGKLSKSKSQKEVLSGEYVGWDDPRTWSVQSLIKRGILAESIREFVEKIGLNQKEIIVPIDDLYAINRRKIDKKSDRYFFVEDPVKIKIDKLLKDKVKIKVHPEKDKYKSITLDKNIFVSLKDFNDFKGKEVRLMHLFNIELNKNSKATSLENKPIRKIHWVSRNVKTRVFMPDGTYSKGLAESHIMKLRKGQTIQFERFGFCKFQGIEKGEYVFWYTHD